MGQHPPSHESTILLTDCIPHAFHHMDRNRRQPIMACFIFHGVHNEAQNSTHVNTLPSFRLLYCNPYVFIIWLKSVHVLLMDDC